MPRGKVPVGSSAMERLQELQSRVNEVTAYIAEVDADHLAVKRRREEVICSDTGSDEGTLEQMHHESMKLAIKREDFLTEHQHLNQQIGEAEREVEDAAAVTREQTIEALRGRLEEQRRTVNGLLRQVEDEWIELAGLLTEDRQMSGRLCAWLDHAGAELGNRALLFPADSKRIHLPVIGERRHC